MRRQRTNPRTTDELTTSAPSLSPSAGPKSVLRPSPSEWPTKRTVVERTERLIGAQGLGRGRRRLRRRTASCEAAPVPPNAAKERQDGDDPGNDPADDDIADVPRRRARDGGVEARCCNDGEEPRGMPLAFSSRSQAIDTSADAMANKVLLLDATAETAPLPQDKL